MKYSYKRIIPILDVTHITYGIENNEFVIHCPKTYDYRLSSSSYRDEFIFFLLATREWVPAEDLLDFYFVKGNNLYNFTTYEKEPRQRLPLHVYIHFIKRILIIFYAFLKYNDF